jgi:HD-like signal output (HDOD) protein
MFADFSLYWVAIIAAISGVFFVFLFRTITTKKYHQRTQNEKTVGKNVTPDNNQKITLELPDSSKPSQNLFQQLEKEVYQLAMDSDEIASSIPSEHTAIINTINKNYFDIVGSKQYLPGKPLIIPQLLRAVKNDDTTKAELVEIVIQDPILTADLLKTANSPFYRLSKKAVENVHEAVVILGNDGLRSVVFASVMRPVFHIPKELFPRFSETVWTIALDTSIAAQVFAKKSHICDAFSAQLLALMSSVGQILIFRATVDAYSTNKVLTPSPMVFAELLNRFSLKASRAIISEWDLDGQFRVALKDLENQTELKEMIPLAQALFFGKLCGMLSVLVKQQRMTEEKALEHLQAAGLTTPTVDAMWKAVQQTGADTL